MQWDKCYVVICRPLASQGNVICPIHLICYALEPWAAGGRVFCMVLKATQPLFVRTEPGRGERQTSKNTACDPHQQQTVLIDCAVSVEELNILNSFNSTAAALSL